MTTNPVLDRLRAERAEAVGSMDTILGNVGENRDLSDAETGLLETTRERITALDAQIAPLEEYAALRGAHELTTAALPRPSDVATTHVAAPAPARCEYRSAGAFVVDYLRANGIMDRGVIDQEAVARIYQTRADQITSDTTGLLPQPIVGAVVSLIDSNRPLIASLGGAKGLGAIPGSTFTRPKVTQHTQVGLQSAEKTAVASRKMTIAPVSFSKATYGGYVDISRQDIDWTVPSAWDILIRDLAAEYAIQTETVVATAFAAAATGTTPALPAAPVLADWMKALYTAGMHSYQAGQRMPTRVWCSLDVWAALGALTDTTRPVFPVDTTREMGAPGTSNLGAFGGDILGLPRIVVPTLAAKTLIVGPDDLYEVYEEVIGLLSVIEPSILGVQVAYGGYLANGTLAGGAYVKVDLSAVTGLPTALEAEPEAEAADEEGNSGKAKR